MENVRRHRDIGLVTNKEKRIKLVSEPNYQITKHFSKNLLAIEMKMAKVRMSKPMYLGKSILDISKTFMYEFWHDYIKPKYKDKAKLYYMDTDSFVTFIFFVIFYIFGILLKNVLKTLTMILKDGLMHLTMIRMTKKHF